MKDGKRPAAADPMTLFAMDDMADAGNLDLAHGLVTPVTTWGRFDSRQPTPATLLVRGNVSVRTTTAADWHYLDWLAKANAHAIGFLSERTWRKYVWGGERNFLGFLCSVERVPVGFCLVTPGKGPGYDVRIQQIAVQEDVRRIEYGSAIVDVVAEFCRTFSRRGISLRCRIDLASNAFWMALGFRPVGTQLKGTLNHMGMVASDDIIRYRRDAGTHPSMFGDALLGGVTLNPSHKLLDDHFIVARHRNAEIDETATWAVESESRDDGGLVGPSEREVPRGVVDAVPDRVCDVERSRTERQGVVRHLATSPSRIVP